MSLFAQNEIKSDRLRRYCVFVLSVPVLFCRPFYWPAFNTGTERTSLSLEGYELQGKAQPAEDEPGARREVVPERHTAVPGVAVRAAATEHAVRA